MGDTFVLVHGACHGGWCWSRVARLLRTQGHEVFTPTLTGFGERAHLLTADTAPATLVRDVVAVLEVEELSDVVLGHSSPVVLSVAQAARERLRRLVILDGLFVGLGTPLGAGLPVTYVRCTDPPYPAIASAHAIARREGWEWRDLAAGHDAMISAPELTVAELTRPPGVPPG